MSGRERTNEGHRGKASPAEGRKPGASSVSEESTLNAAKSRAGPMDITTWKLPVTLTKAGLRE